jgi:hypothetical protein
MFCASRRMRSKKLAGVFVEGQPEKILHLRAEDHDGDPRVIQRYTGNGDELDQRPHARRAHGEEHGSARRVQR